MNNPFDEIRRAVQEARLLDRAVESEAYSLAYLLRGKLRLLSPSQLSDFKKELRDFNIHTGKWKD